jgi:hypothetical protein
MQRDWDTIRELLLAIEALAPGQTLTLNDFEKARCSEINYHALLLDEAGLIEASFFDGLSDGRGLTGIERLTWDGHDFLDAIRSDTVWKRTRAMIMEKTGTTSFAVVKDMAVQVARTMFGL